MTGEHEDHTELLCNRCGALLTPGDGSFYVVRIEAFADPSPPSLESALSPAEPDEQWIRLLAELEGMSERELVDQVYRRLTVRLCGGCYRRWIENPLGG